MRPALRSLPTAIAAVTATAATAVALGACGGPSKQDAVNVASSWLKAIEQGDDLAACKLMTERATQGIAARYVTGQEGKPCQDVVAAYRDALGKDKLHAITSGGLEYNGDVQKNRLGVFPKAKDYQYEVVLMQRDGGQWRVESSGIGLGRLTTGG